MDITALFQGFSAVVLDPLSLLLIFMGVSIGIVFGAIPGLTSSMAVLMFLPMTYTLEATQGISTLVALYIGGTSGGLISAILLNIPGTPASVATCLDGFPMAQNGQAGKALGLGIVFSFVGTLLGVAVLIVISPLLADVAIKFGGYEYCALSLFSLSLVIALTGKDIDRGLISAVFGSLFATVGLSPIDSRERFTFHLINLTGGFKLVAFLIGLFAITEVVNYAETARTISDLKVKTNPKIRGFGFSAKEFCEQIFNSLRSAMIGIGIGILPGIGGSVSSMLAYTMAKNSSGYPQLFGTGIPDGVVASETANNATIGGAMIPLLSLGIPGDGVTAILLGGFMIHDIVPGPLIFQKSASIVYGVFIAMIVASIVMLCVEFWCLRVFLKIFRIPKHYLLPVIVILCAVGAIGDSNRIFDMWGILIFGLAGYGFLKAGIPLTPMILGFILGPMFEFNLRKSSQIFMMDKFSLLEHPIALIFLLITVVTVVVNIRSSRNGLRAEKNNLKI
jgi:putative tricarboxylic transport membrane protein